MDHIPTKIALSRQGITFSYGGGLLCPFCNDDLESTFHLFLSCKVTYSVWQSIYNWLNISVTLPQNHFHHYLNHFVLVNAKKGWKAWSIIWFATVWVIRRHQNDIIFNKISLSIHHILDTARVNAWLWIKNILGVEFSLYSDWLSKPLLCLNFSL
ncbi:putative reverse transcriptase zinc-binding domain-containing protein [Lupinus albus]|uniref:Putative reverse transcriptase zinc-binding domain-containing protein n=1 Tax=Lupinus albus TaxID=3870 RepID=A0A6A4PKT8_LUPAL|nr:putative reverse transcriptase zinc-binding domain-containing protein [Lupinus albus]